MFAALNQITCPLKREKNELELSFDELLLKSSPFDELSPFTILKVQSSPFYSKL
jgi:hypothetical protein